MRGRLSPTSLVAGGRRAGRAIRQSEAGGRDGKAQQHADVLKNPCVEQTELNVLE